MSPRACPSSTSPASSTPRGTSSTGPTPIPSSCPSGWVLAATRQDIQKWEVRDGGAWRFVQTDPDGNEWGFHGVFHGPQTPDQMIQTFEFEGVPGHVSFSEVRLEENDGKTIAHTHSVFMSLEDRDGMVQSGMETGVVEGYERLDELVAKLVPVA